MNLKGMVKAEYTDDHGIRRPVLVKDEFQDACEGIPLMDLGGMDLPKELEGRLLGNLRDMGIVEYRDALMPGASDKIAQAIRATIKASVQDVLTICQGEYKMLQEAGYNDHK